MTRVATCRLRFFSVFVFICCLASALSQTTSSTRQFGTPPDAVSWTFSAAGPAQRKAINAVYLIQCARTGKRGSGFLVTDGLVVTNEHVIRGCDPSEIAVGSVAEKDVAIKNMVSDPYRDLALLIPKEKPAGGLTLGTDQGLKLGQSIWAWGFPVISEGPSPVLSVGYVAGFNAFHPIQNVTVKHIVVNGAYNPGNSGGPVFLEGDDKVLGVVVWKAQLVSDQALTVADGLKNSSVALMGGFTRVMPDGSRKEVSNDEAIGSIIEEFYNSVQVMVGEAISVTELRTFIKEQRANLK